MAAGPFTVKIGAPGDAQAVRAAVLKEVKRQVNIAENTEVTRSLNILNDPTVNPGIFCRIYSDATTAVGGQLFRLSPQCAFGCP